MTDIVYIIDDEAAVRETLGLLFASVSLEVRPALSVEGFFRRYDPERTGCIVMDLRLPGLSGLPALDAMAERAVAAPVIFLSGFAEARFVAQAMKRGAYDFFEKPFRRQELLESVQEALACDRKRRAETARDAALRRQVAELSPRERQVLGHLAQGRSMAELASALGLARKTLERHRRCGLSKVELKPGQELRLLPLLEIRP